MVFESLKFYTVCEVAEGLRVSEDFIMELIEEKVLEGIDLGGKGVWIVEERAILEFLCNCSNRIGSNGMNFEDDLLAKDSVVSKVKEVVITGLDGGKVVGDFDNMPVLKSPFGKCKDKESIGSEDSLVSEFIFDEEQAKKPISNEIVFSSLGNEVHSLGVCEKVSDEKELLRTRGEGTLNKKIKRNFVISEFIIEQLNRVRDILGESMSSIVECALSMYFQSKGFVSEHNFKV